MTTGVPVAHFEEKYEIFPDGKIWNKGTHTWKTTSQNSNGYLKVLLALNGKRKQCLVHQLVALHFLPNPYKHTQVNHKDGDKTNNRVDNLEWVSAEDNIQHSLEIGLRKGFMSREDKETYLHRVLAGEQVKDIAETIGRRPETLHKMLRETAKRLGIFDQWQATMKENRKNVALRQLEKINNRNSK